MVRKKDWTDALGAEFEEDVDICIVLEALEKGTDVRVLERAMDLDLRIELGLILLRLQLGLRDDLGRIRCPSAHGPIGRFDLFRDVIDPRKPALA